MASLKTGNTRRKNATSGSSKTAQQQTASSPLSSQAQDYSKSSSQIINTLTALTTPLTTALTHAAPTIIVLAIVCTAWQISADKNPTVARAFASPSAIIEAVRLNWPTLTMHLSVTIFEAAWGFALAVVIGILLGVALYLWSLANAAFMPILTTIQTLPLISITPFVLWWFGFDEIGKIVLVAVFGAFPIAIQTSRGLRAVPQYFADVALTCGATRSWTLWHVLIRVATRQIFSGIRIAGTYTLGTAATAEYMGSRRGIGIFLQSAYNSFQAPLVWACTLSIALLTGILMLVIVATERIMLGDPEQDLID
ncbi:ABC transporter permease [Alloscardovia omnicolens]|uniref:ABC transporter permease n=1 Tax=Alloscardovia omnicolens TaxID=419015 RepID=UPI0003B42E23|nr:ABC transporter permease [Alloscardovia omnicolens]MDK6249939.1 ABC transporter permease [Alloscardovia omnicolens]MDK6445319.1 ABC transporter permease [Alloscardovia omnicolens]MDK6644098.1 ABC transporter permease [Alloscardovia omnicolens]MDU6532290.1 ABC transporter permease [Alloscardovia omnicolens]MDU6640432.1 ABC transporter permease [Alloscardovia omnicolens]